jgi:DNA-binding transcriptional LysR family regulator
MDMTRAVVFAKVVEAQGFSAAGRLLAMPKTTVSKKVSDLEAELGVRLLNRTTRSVSLTEAGSRVYTHCLAAIRHMDAAEREARLLQNEPEGLLTIAAPGAIGVPFLLPALTAFMERYPAVQVTLLSMNELVDLERERIDVMIWAGATMPIGHSVKLVASAELGLYASRAYVELHGTPTMPDTLSAHRVVGFSHSVVGVSRPVWHLQRGDETVEVTPAAPPRFRSNDRTAVLAAIIAGYGVCGSPTRLVEQHPERDKLVRVLPEWRIAPVDLNAVFPDASSLKIRLFIDFVVDWFRRLSSGRR